MKKKKDGYLIKGTYSHPQIFGYFTVKQYIITECEDKLCLLLKFQNESKLAITAAYFTVRQLDASGKTLGLVKIKYSDLYINAGQSYCTPKGIVVADNCVDCVIEMNKVICGNVKYSFRNGQVSAHYDKRGYGEKQRKRREYGMTRVRRKYSGGGGFYRFVAFVSLVLVTVSFFALISLTERAEEERLIEEKRTHTGTEYESTDTGSASAQTTKYN